MGLSQMKDVFFSKAFGVGIEGQVTDACTWVVVW
jgi:hypothetical protein